MPMQVRSGVKVFRMSDKLVRAELKNRCEYDRLSRHVSKLNKEQSEASYSIEKEKLAAIEQLRNMHRVSGFSQEAVPLEGPDDASFRKSPYAKSVKVLSNAELIKWRYIERELEKMLARDAGLLIPPWDWDSDDDISANLAKLLRQLGFDVNNEDMLRAMEHDKLRMRPRTRLRHVDVFKCLRDDASVNNGNKCKRGKSKTHNTKDFTLRDWSNKLENDYIKLVATPGEFSKYRNQLRKSMSDGGCGKKAQPIKMRVTPAPTAPRNHVRHKHVGIPEVTVCHPSNTMDNTVPVSKMNADNIPSRHKERRSQRASIRPHTASGSRSRPEKVTTGRRPSSAKNQAIKEENAILCDSEDADSWSNDSSEEFIVNVSDINSSEARVEGHRSGSHTETKLPVRSLFLLKNVLDDDAQLGSAQSARDKPEAMSCKMMISNIVTSLSELTAIKTSCELSGIDIGKLQSKLEKLSGIQPYSTAPFHPTPKRPTNPLAAEDKEYFRNVHSFDEADALEDVVLSDTETEDTQGDDIPRWKRDLLREAPLGDIGECSPSNIKLIMSKTSKEHQLDNIVRMNITDVNTINATEHARRIRARLHLYFTMVKLDEVLARVMAER